MAAAVIDADLQSVLLQRRETIITANRRPESGESLQKDVFPFLKRLQA